MLLRWIDRACQNVAGLRYFPSVWRCTFQCLAEPIFRVWKTAFRRLDRKQPATSQAVLFSDFSQWDRSARMLKDCQHIRQILGIFHGFAQSTSNLFHLIKGEVGNFFHDLSDAHSPKVNGCLRWVNGKGLFGGFGGAGGAVAGHLAGVAFVQLGEENGDAILVREMAGTIVAVGHPHRVEMKFHFLQRRKNPGD